MMERPTLMALIRDQDHLQTLDLPQTPRYRRRRRGRRLEGERRTEDNNNIIAQDYRRHLPVKNNHQSDKSTNGN